MNPSTRPTRDLNPEWAGTARVALVALTILLGAALRFHGLDTQSLWDDEGISYNRAALPFETMLSQLPTEQMPAYYALLHVWSGVFGDQVWTMRALSALWGSAAIWAVYLAGRSWFGWRIGLVAAILMAFSPSAIRQSQTLRMYPMLVTATLLAAATGTRAIQLFSEGVAADTDPAVGGHGLRETRLALLAYIVSSALAATTHLIGLLGVATLSLWAVWTYRRDPHTIRRWVWAQVAVALVPAIWLLYSLVISPADEMLGRTGGNLPGLLSLGRQAITVLGAVWDAPAAPVSILAGVMVGCLAIVGLARAQREPTVSRKALLWLVPGATLGVLSALAWLADAPIYTRHLAPLTPWAYLAAAMGLSALGRIWTWAPGAALVIVVAAMAINLGAYYQRPTEDLAPLASYIAANAQPGDAVVHSSKWRAQCFHYYDRSGLPSYEEPDVSGIDTISERYQRIWLLVYGYHPTQPIQDALMATWPQVGTWDAGTTQLMLYLPRRAPSQMAQPLHADLGPIRLLGYYIMPDAPAPGDVVQLTLWWESVDAVEPGYKVFIHLEDDAGQIWGQRDAEPVDGLRPTWTWEPGEVITDSHAFAVDATAPSGDYRLLIGLYDLPTGHRLPILGADAPHQGDAILLREIHLASAP